MVCLLVYNRKGKINYLIFVWLMYNNINKILNVFCKLLINVILNKVNCFVFRYKNYMCLFYIVSMFN